MKNNIIIIAIFAILLIFCINSINGESITEQANDESLTLLTSNINGHKRTGAKSSKSLHTMQSVRKANRGLNRKQAAKVAQNRIRSDKKRAAAKELQQIIMERLATRPTNIVGQYDLIKNAKINDLLALAETIKKCWIKSPRSKKAQEKSCWDFVKLIYSDKFEVHNGKQLNRLKYLEFWHGSDFSMHQAMKLADKAKSKYIDMCAGTISGQILSGWGAPQDSYNKLEKWMKKYTGNSVDLSDKNDALWTPMSAYLAEKYFTKERPIDAIAFMDYYRKHTGRQDHPYFANDEFPQLIKTDAKKNHVYFLINERCKTIVQQSKTITMNSKRINDLGLRCTPTSNCLANNINNCACINGLDYDKLIKIDRKADDDAYQALIKDIDVAFSSDKQLLKMMKKRAWLILAVQNNEILCDANQIEQHVHARTDHGLAKHTKTLQRVRVGQYTSDDDGSTVDATIQQLKSK